METWKELQLENMAATFTPDATKDAQLTWGTRRINAELSPEDRIALGHYRDQKAAFEAVQRERQAANYQAGK